jgi:hypothetical protein
VPVAAVANGQACAIIEVVHRGGSVRAAEPENIPVEPDPGNAGVGSAYDPDHPDNRRLRLVGRRGYPGRPEGHLRERRVRCNRDHGGHRPEHSRGDGRDRARPRPDPGPGRRRVQRPEGGRGQDGDARLRRRHRDRGEGPARLAPVPLRARPGDGLQDWLRPAPAGGRGCPRRGAAASGDAGDAERPRGAGADGHPDPNAGRGRRGRPAAGGRGGPGRAGQGGPSRGAAGDGRPRHAHGRADLLRRARRRTPHSRHRLHVLGGDRDPAHGLSLEDAIVRAKAYVTEAIRAGLPVGQGIGPTDHFFYLRRPGECEGWLERLAPISR